MFIKNPHNQIFVNHSQEVAVIHQEAKRITLIYLTISSMKSYTKPFSVKLAYQLTQRALFQIKYIILESNKYLRFKTLEMTLHHQQQLILFNILFSMRCMG